MCKVNEQSSRLRSPRKLENRTTSGLLFATIVPAALVLFASGVVFAQADSFLGTSKLNVKGRCPVARLRRLHESKLSETADRPKRCR
jgi:hypothetical protein